jgi:hypothetical protein
MPALGKSLSGIHNHHGGSMRVEQSAVLVSLRRVQKFLDAHATTLADVNASTRKQLDDVVTQLVDAGLAQETGDRASQGETSRQRVSLHALRSHYMAPVAELAKLKLPDVPELAALRLPRGNAGAVRVVNAANAMADAATPFASTLIAAGLPSTFADDIRKAAAAVVEAIGDRGGHLNQRSNATATLVAAERNGRSMLRVLNALIMARIGNDPGLIGEWKGAKLVRRTPVLVQHVAGPVTPSTPVAPVAPVKPAVVALSSEAPSMQAVPVAA